MTTPSSSVSQRCIYSDADMEAWKDSPLKQDLLRVVAAMGKSCAQGKGGGYRPDEPLHRLSNCMASLHGSLRCMEIQWMEEVPPQKETPTQHFRFGNPAFREWNARLKERSYAIVAQILDYKQDSNTTVEQAAQAGHAAAATSSRDEPATEKTDPLSLEQSEIIQELQSYLHDAFGHPTRLDYGTGHESSFMVFLYGLIKLGCFDDHKNESAKDADTRALPPSMESLQQTTLSIMTQYLKVCRRIQTDYRLEPAGSHGVWGLDDYHCLPFYFGACQLQNLKQQNEQDQHYDVEELKTVANATTSRPPSDPRLIPTFLYYGCIQYIRQLKRGAPLGECSPMLHDIGQNVPTWQKVSHGLLRYYEGEVLNKQPVVQHFVFGKHLFKATWTPTASSHVDPLLLPTGVNSSAFRTAGASSSKPMTTRPGFIPPTTTAGHDDNLAMTKAPWAK